MYLEFNFTTKNIWDGNIKDFFIFYRALLAGVNLSRSNMDPVEWACHRNNEQCGKLLLLLLLVVFSFNISNYLIWCGKNIEFWVTVVCKLRSRCILKSSGFGQQRKSLLLLSKSMFCLLAQAALRAPGGGIAMRSWPLLLQTFGLSLSFRVFFFFFTASVRSKPLWPPLVPGVL